MYVFKVQFSTRIRAPNVIFIERECKLRSRISPRVIRFFFSPYFSYVEISFFIVTSTFYRQRNFDGPTRRL